MRNVVFDAWCIVALLKMEAPAYHHIRTLLYSAHEGQLNCFMSLINLGEVFYSAGRARGREWATEKVFEVRALPISFLPIDEDLVFQAATYKMTYRISYADAFALATAVVQQATLITGDPEFQNLTTLFDIELLPGKRG